MRRFLIMLFLIITGSISTFCFQGCKGGNFATQPYYGYVTSTFTPTDTPIPSATPVPFMPVTFNSSSAVSNWTVNTTQPSGLSVGITFNSSFSGCASSTGAMEVTVGFGAVTQGVFLNETLPSPVNLAGQSITLILDVTGGWNSDSEQVYGAIFAGQGSTAGPNGGTAYSSVYQQGTGLYNAATSTSSSSGCVTLTLTMPTTLTPEGTYSSYSVFPSTAGVTFDPTQVEILGIQLGTGSSGTGFGNTIFDIQSWL